MGCNSVLQILWIRIVSFGGIELSLLRILKHKMPIVFEYTPEYSEQLNYTFNDFEKIIKSVDYYVVKKIDYYNYLIKPKQIYQFLIIWNYQKT